MYAIYNTYGDLVSVSQSPDVVMQSIQLPPEIDTLEAAIAAGYVVSVPQKQSLALNQMARFKRGFITNKTITDFRKRKVTVIGV